jgi:hypothetical protein
MKTRRDRRSYFFAIKWIPVWVALINAITQIVTSAIGRL